MAFERLKLGWDWFVDGLAEAWLLAVDRWSGLSTFTAEAEDGGRIVGADGSVLGHVVADGAGIRLEPSSLAERLTGARIDIHLPSSFLFRRDLEPVAAQSAPYLDAFVRHQIDKITPWRMADVFYQIVHAPMPSDPTRLSVEIGVVPKRLVQPFVDTLSALGPKRLRLVGRHASKPTEFHIPVVDNALRERMQSLRRPIQAGLIALALCLVSAIAWTWWQAQSVRADIADQDQVIEQRSAILAAARRREQAGAEIETALRTLRASRPKVVELIEALSAALPDSAFLTTLHIQKEQIQISGVTHNLSELVPALEAPGRFKDAAFAEATTKLQTGDGDRFHIQMRASAPSDGGTAP